jgi:MFS family permease
MTRFTPPRIAIMLVFAAYGAGVGAWAGAIPLVTATAAIDSYHLGVALTLSSLASISAMSLCGRLGRFLSNRAVMLAILPALALATLLLLTATGPRAFYGSILAFGLATGMLDVFMNAEASAIEHDMRRPIFTTFHGSASLSMAVFALLSSFVSYHLGPAATGAAVLLACAAAWLLVWRHVPPRVLSQGEAGGLSSLPSLRPLLIMGLAIGLIIACEVTATYWSAKLLDEQAPALAAITGLGAAFYGACSALLRFYGDRLRARFGDITALMTSMLVSAVAFVALAMSPGFGFSVVAFAVTGFGLAVLCPCLFNMAAAEIPANRAAGLSFLSLVSGAPRTLAPWFFGWVATETSLRSAFGLCAAALAVSFCCIWYLNALKQAAHKAPAPAQ